MSPTSDPLLAAGKFIRLAFIEIRFGKEKHYLRVVNMYCQLLNLTPLPDPKDVRQSYSYEIGQGDQAMELLFVWKDDGSINKKNRTVLYWEVASGEIVAIDRELRSLPDFTSIAPVTTTTAIVGGVKRETQRSIIEDSSGNLFGPIGNPPFPFM